MPTRPREGSRELTELEVAEVRRLHKAVKRLRYRPGPARDRARQVLLGTLVRLYREGVPVTHLGAAMGVSGQRAQQLTAEGHQDQEAAP